MIPIIEFGYKYYKNRTRFDDMIIDRRFPSLLPVIERLYNIDKSLSDEEVMSGYIEFSNSMQSNTYAIAQLELAITSLLCSYRKHLSEKLLERPFRAIIYSLGNEINETHVIRFIDYYMLKRNAEPYGGLPPKRGIDFMKELKNDKLLIQRVLAKMILANKIELGEA